MSRVAEIGHFFVPLLSCFFLHDLVYYIVLFHFFWFFLFSSECLSFDLSRVRLSYGHD